MASICIVGKVLDLGIDKATILDLKTSEEFECTLNTEGLEKNQTGLFSGDLIKGKITVKYIHLKKFLNPLYEQDLFSSAGKYTLIQPIEDPFPEEWEKLNESL